MALPLRSRRNWQWRSILLKKGVLTNAEYAQIEGNSATPPIRLLARHRSQPVQAQTSAPAAQPVQEITLAKTSSSVPTPVAKASPAIASDKPAAPAVVAAMTPIRVLPVGGVSREPFTPAFKVGEVAFAPYGAMKIDRHRVTVPRLMETTFRCPDFLVTVAPMARRSFM